MRRHGRVKVRVNTCLSRSIARYVVAMRFRAVVIRCGNERDKRIIVKELEAQLYAHYSKPKDLHIRKKRRIPPNTAKHCLIRALKKCYQRRGGYW
jgi:hypothetical protein